MKDLWENVDRLVTKKLPVKLSQDMQVVLKHLKVVEPILTRANEREVLAILIKTIIGIR